MRSSRRSRSRSRSRGRDRKNNRRKPSSSSSSEEPEPAKPAAKDVKGPEKDSAAPQAVPDWLSDLVGAGPSNGGAAESWSAIPGAVSAVGSSVKYKTSKPVIIPQNLVGLLTGGGELALRQIRETTGAEIGLRQDTQHLGYSIAVVSGTAQEVFMAEEMIKQKIGLASVSGNGNIVKEIDVHQDHLNIIVGHNGMNLAETRQKAGGISIDFRMPQYQGMAVKFIIGPGTLQHVTTAEQLIRRKTAELDLEQMARRQARNPQQGAGGTVVVCPHYVSGHCTAGSACHFAHVGDEDEVPPEKKLAAPCRFFERGSCARGKGCLYTHSDEELKIAMRSLSGGYGRVLGEAQKSLPAPEKDETSKKEDPELSSGFL
ncbi:unnamed protein product [Polarella glacialis]|uniref:C3H1-type domain-containing protein n=1 Tax=Polarella glacialis TaxID=89957 RepID=A0A813DAL3_POLGL|nr:unnamed protein product [Polarella glacialis]